MNDIRKCWCIIVVVLTILGPSITLADGDHIAHYRSTSIAELRRRAQNPLDSMAVLELGNRNDAESIPMLRRLAASPSLDARSLSKRIRDKKQRDLYTQLYAERLLETSYAAKAALTKMHVANYFGDFIVQLSTGNPRWKTSIIGDLVYIGDVRAVRYLGPLLDDKTCTGYGSVCTSSVGTIGASARGALASIIRPPFMTNDHPFIRSNPFFHEADWKKWWQENQNQSDAYFKSLVRSSTSTTNSAASNPSQFTVLPNSEIKGTIASGSDAGSIELDFDSVQVQLPMPSGQTIPVNIVMALAPQNGFLWWQYRIVSTSDTVDNVPAVSDAYKFYLTTNLLHAFRLESNRITISDGGVRYQSTDTALSSIVPVVQKKLTNGDKTPALTTRSVDLWKVLGQQFFLKDGRVGTSTIMSVVLRNAQWVLSITGPNNDSAVVTLDSGYKVVSATLNGKAAYP